MEWVVGAFSAPSNSTDPEQGGKTPYCKSQNRVHMNLFPLQKRSSRNCTLLSEFPVAHFVQGVWKKEKYRKSKPCK